MKVKVKKLHPHAKLPTKSSEGAACFDVYAASSESIWPGVVTAVHTGLAFELPKNFELEIRPRSGLALKGISIINSPGTLDSDYRGELKILFLSVRDRLYTVKPGDRVAQVKINKVYPTKFVEVKELEETKRGEKGFGSTGR